DWNKNVHSTKKRSTTDDPATPADGPASSVPSVQTNKSLMRSEVISEGTGGKSISEDLDVIIVPKWKKILKTVSTKKELHESINPKISGNKAVLRNTAQISGAKIREGSDYTTVEILTKGVRRESHSTQKEKADSEQISTRNPAESAEGKEDSAVSQTQKVFESTRPNDHERSSEKLFTSAAPMESPDSINPPLGEEFVTVAASSFRSVDYATKRNKTTALQKNEEENKRKKAKSKFQDSGSDSVSEKISTKSGSSKEEGETETQNPIDSEEDDSFDGELYGETDGIKENKIGDIPDNELDSKMDGSGEAPEQLTKNDVFEIPEADSEEMDEGEFGNGKVLALAFFEFNIYNTLLLSLKRTKHR
ncbi:unnamed protein product, partial [Gongylonema pulchrum]|uniref:Serum response factor-binding protein 1 n=1 Tax=Gongylonema pulchrum TaxID=637853 RepID=A0A183DCY4_9BILA